MLVTKQGVWFWLSPLGPLVRRALGLSMQSTLREELCIWIITILLPPAPLCKGNYALKGTVC